MKEKIVIKSHELFLPILLLVLLAYYLLDPYDMAPFIKMGVGFKYYLLTFSSVFLIPLAIFSSFVKTLEKFKQENHLVKRGLYVFTLSLCVIVSIEFVVLLTRFM